MAHEEKLAEYARQRLTGRDVPADLRTLLVLQWERDAATPGADPLHFLGVSLLEVGETHDLLDHSYLNDKDRADPDTMANVAAMKSTCEHAAFVARDHDGNVLGYWFGPENLGIGAAPILKLDTEGQFSLLAGLNLSEALLGDRVFEDAEKFAQLRQEFAKAGIVIGADRWDQLVYPTPPTDPAVFHEQRYEQNRNSR